MKRVALLLALIATSAAAPFENSALNLEAFTSPIAGLGEAQFKSFRAGSALFRQAWVIGPSQDHPEVQGLGPLYNRLSCVACHARNGRGAPPDSENGVVRSMVVRLGVAGKDSHGGPLPHPIYGGQLNPEGIPGAHGEGRAILAYDEFEAALDDGSRVPMRRPHLSFEDLAYGPLGSETQTSVRIAPPVFGLGLLEAIPEEQILSNAGPSGSGRGRANFVWDIENGRRTLGRFGLKANQPSLKQQVANAFAEDIGITSQLFPHESCTTKEPECNALAAQETRPELTSSQLASMIDYLRDLAVPARRHQEDASVLRGEALFRSLGCLWCHRDSFTLGPSVPVSTLAGAVIHPYSDLLVHDMGADLADGREDFEAGPRDWRTPPLWGLGLAGRFGDGSAYLHDGRARTLAEAILWHGGEAQSAAQAFRSLSRDERDDLLAFLNSL